MSTEAQAPCSHRGHCWHEPDGSQYQRHSSRPKGSVKVVCCDCPSSAVVPTHAPHTTRSLAGVSRKVHGPNVPKPTPAPAA